MYYETHQDSRNEKILGKVQNSVDHDLRLEADHSPRLGRWIVIQREQFVIYRN
jgi:hypothetical protein